MEIVHSNKKGKKLCLDGFMYVIKVNLQTKKRWECWRRRNQGCPGSLITDVNDENPIIGKEHTHQPEVTGIKLVKAKNRMKERATQSSEKPANLLSETLETVDDDVRRNFPQFSAAKRMIRRQRDPEFPPVPATLRELEIDDDSQWAKTGGENPQRFKFFDNGRDSNSRIIAYSSDQQLRHLANASTWYMDGNFKMSPQGFKQLYVIHASMGESSVPAVFAFLERKNQAAYKELFEAIEDKLLDMNLTVDPDKVICDFESALIQAVGNIFGDVDIQGCFFHLTQSTWRKIQDLRLVERYFPLLLFHIFLIEFLNVL